MLLKEKRAVPQIATELMRGAQLLCYLVSAFNWNRRLEYLGPGYSVGRTYFASCIDCPPIVKQVYNAEVERSSSLITCSSHQWSQISTQTSVKMHV